MRNGCHQWAMVWKAVFQPPVTNSLSLTEVQRTAGSLTVITLSRERHHLDAFMSSEDNQLQYVYCTKMYE